MDNLTKKKYNVDYIIEVIREMAYILIDEDKDFDIVVKLKGPKENDIISDGCLTDCNINASDVVINRV
jgi:hypothetical protein